MSDYPTSLGKWSTNHRIAKELPFILIYFIKTGMKGNLFVHVPYWKLPDVRDRVLELSLPIEIYFSASDLDILSINKVKEDLSALLERGLPFTLHAPYMDLNIGSVDSKIRGVTLQRLMQLLPIIELIRPKMVIIHPGFDRWRYGGAIKEWLEMATQSMLELLNFLPGWVRIAVENIFEEEPSTILELIERLSHPRVGHCFDIGHYLLFSKVKLNVWLETLGKHLFEVHLHDNQGDRDSHLGLGKGIAPLEELFGFIEKLSKKPLLVIEARSEEDALLSLQYLMKHCSHLLHL